MADASFNSFIGNVGGPFQSTSTVLVETPSTLQTHVDLAPMSTTVKLEPTESKLTLKGDGKLDSDVHLDLKPVSADVCLNVTLGRLPPTRVRQPYRQRVGLSVFGVEVLGVEWCGELDTVIEDAPRRPTVVGAIRTEDHRAHAPERDGGGLRIKIGG